MKGKDTALKAYLLANAIALATFPAVASPPKVAPLIAAGMITYQNNCGVELSLGMYDLAQATLRLYAVEEQIDWFKIEDSQYKANPSGFCSTYAKIISRVKDENPDRD